MGWLLSDARHIRHTNGAKITLVSGTWRAPEEINPRMPDSIDAEKQADLIRQGIRFAHNATAKQYRKV